MEHAEIDTALQASVDALASLLRAVPEPGALTPGGTWTAQQTAAHLLANVRMYAGLLAGEPSPILRREDYGPYNAGVFLGQPEDDLAALATRISQAAGALRRALAAVDLDAPRPWHFGRTLPAAFLAALVVNECLMHGTDIARAAAVDWDGDEAAARTTWRAIGPPLTVTRFLPDAAGDLDATFAMGLEAEPPAAFQVTGGQIARDDDGDADCLVEGRGMALLRWFFQRDPWEAAGLTATGPRADLAADLAGLLRRI